MVDEDAEYRCDDGSLSEAAIAGTIETCIRPRHVNSIPLNIAVRVGCHLTYETPVQTSVLFVLKPRPEGRVRVMQERISFGIGQPSSEFQDSHGNLMCRSMFMPGRNEVTHDALVAVSSHPDGRNLQGNLVPVGQLPFELLRYTLPSRYCDSDKLMNFAWNHFGQIPHGLPRVPGHLRLGAQ